ncbi:MAG: Addiction module antitoxin, RelB/DinJ family protein [Candidatus Kaiserbacteria bacterium GW2011_GWC2_52_8b]|uniref:Addiction module antitoxin, RelB/DinJ family protein n=2 Tax=Candidatus Kaiseribacteriota TaxID=1752734 RepID=A0A0G1ZQN4_9BACT|nr:MAG: Addiction module antitoxin, RelB/DinJ family protein [Candidatus Kaiserbacteria bacterium GW2011_GWA2_52_12]KKW30552.1 MAG: Addiction module antitoxin, RelB/DinJ family protein [Candidatus Kaiserbacteria bacterium GW2011_GWC2_52_8b]
MNTTLQVRIDKKTKERARKAFRASGIDLSSGLRLFLTHIGRTGEIPQEMFTYDNAPKSFMKKLMREADYALKHGKSYSSTKEMFDDILGRR